jgi:hypothetical protein
LLAAGLLGEGAGREAGPGLAAGFVASFASRLSPGFAAAEGAREARGVGGVVGCPSRRTGAGRAPLVVAAVLTGPWTAVALGAAWVGAFFAKMGLLLGAGRLGAALRAEVISRGSSGVGEYTTIFCPSPSSLVAESRLTRARSPGASP